MVLRVPKMLEEQYVISSVRQDAIMSYTVKPWAQQDMF
jgi:hypothetical protein